MSLIVTTLIRSICEDNETSEDEMEMEEDDKNCPIIILRAGFQGGYVLDISDNLSMEAGGTAGVGVVTSYPVAGLFLGINYSF